MLRFRAFFLDLVLSNKGGIPMLKVQVLDVIGTLNGIVRLVPNNYLGSLPPSLIATIQWRKHIFRFEGKCWCRDLKISSWNVTYIHIYIRIDDA